MGPVIILLQAIRNLTKAGSIKSIEQAYQLAKRELGDRFNTVKKQIDDAFNQGKREQTLDKRTKDIKKTEESGIKSLDEGKTQLDELSSDDPMGDLENILKGGPPRKKTKKEQLEDALTQLNKKKSLGTMSQEAMIRSAVREFLERRVKDGSLTIPNKTDLDSIMQVTGNVDPIDIFRKAYGEDAIGGVAGIQDEFGNQLQGSKNFRELGDNFEKLFFRESDGGLRYNTNPKPVDQYGFDEGLMSNEELSNKIRKELDEVQKLEKFDVTDRKPNAEGGLMRTSYAVGSGIKLAVFLARKGKNLMTEIKKAVDNIMLSGDSKIDADVAVDDMFENLNVDRDQFDQKDIMDAYGEAYNIITKNRGLVSTKVNLPEGVKAEDTILPTSNLISGQLKVMRLAEDIQPGLFENLTDKQRDIILKYGELVDRDLLKSIVLDPDPNNQANAISTIEQVKTMGDKGMSTDEIMSVLQSTSRRKQAEGGLAEILKV